MQSDVRRGKFLHLSSVIFQRLLLRALREADAALLPMTPVLMQGRFVVPWTELEHQCIVKMFFWMPLSNDLQPDWPTFHAISQITTKSTAAICRHGSTTAHGGEDILSIPPAELRKWQQLPTEVPFQMLASVVGRLSSKLQFSNLSTSCACTSQPSFGLRADCLKVGHSNITARCYTEYAHESRAIRAVFDKP